MVISLILAAFVVSGCATDKPVTSLSLFGNARGGLQSPICGPDVIQLQTALIERPINDRFLNSELWLLADEQIIPLEQKAILEDAGFRIGLVNGLNPSGLHTLLTSNRSCQLPWRQYTRAGNPAVYALGPTITRCEIECSGSAEPLEFEKANCLMQITPTIAPDHKVHLHCVPRIRHGESEMVAKPSGDGTAHMLVEEFPIKEFANLAFEITLETNQYLIIGARPDHIGQVGWRCFWGGDEPVPVQRLLVIRTCPPAGSPTDNSDEIDPKTPRVPSVAQLASQAAAP
jgi:hypothetical protein